MDPGRTDAISVEPDGLLSLGGSSSLHVIALAASRVGLWPTVEGARQQRRGLETDWLH